MKRVLLFILAIIICSGIIVFARKEPTNKITTEELPKLYDNISLDQDTGVVYDNTELIVFCSATEPEKYMAQIAEQYNFNIIYHILSTDVFLVRFNETFDNVEELKNTAESLKALSCIDDAFWNTVFTEDGDAVPNDPWGTDRGEYDTLTWNQVPDGQNWGLEAINAIEAWESLDIMEDVKVGIIDYAPQVHHEDLEIESDIILMYEDGTNAKYNLKNEHIEYKDLDSHGTFVAGIIGAKWNNGVGVSGLTANKAKLFHSMTSELNEFNEKKEYYTSFGFFLSISNLLDKGVQVINISLNTDRLKGFAASRGNEAAITSLEENANRLEDMLRRYIERNRRDDFVICVAAGNNNNIRYVKDKNSIYGYKEAEKSFFWKKKYSGDVDAKYNNFISLINDEIVRSKIMVIGSIGYSENEYFYSSFSNIGNRVDLVAPGEGIYSLTMEEYGCGDGTSYATPYVSGAAALLFAINPDFTGEQVKSILLDTCNRQNTYDGVNCGLLDVAEAVEKATEIYLDILKQEYQSRVTEQAVGEEIINYVYADMDNNGIPEGYFITVNENEAEDAKHYLTAGYGTESFSMGKLWYCYKKECRVLNANITGFFNLEHHVLKNGTQILINSCHGGTGWYDSTVYSYVDGKIDIIDRLPNGMVDEEGNLTFTDDWPNFLGQKTYSGEIVNGKVVNVEVIDEGYYDEQAAEWRSS